MNTKHGHQNKRRRQVSLNSSETISLERPEAGEEIKITVENGIIRISANQYNNSIDLTLAFATKADVIHFNYPEDLGITIEAIKETTYFVESINTREAKTIDTITDWVIQLHVVRNEANLERRLLKFFELLMTRQGKRTPKGLMLEYTLSHARIAEIVGSTRSTVSRTISTLRKTKRIYIDELKNQIIIPVN